MDCDICTECGEYADFEYTEDEGYVSNCCNAGPYDVDIELEER